MQAYMKDRRNFIPTSLKPWKSKEDALDKLLKAGNSDFHYGILHMEYYYFC